MQEKNLLYSEGAEAKDLRIILHQYLQYWYLYLIGGIAGVGVAFICLLYATPQYAISATMLIKDHNSGSGLSESAAFSELDLLSSSKSIDNEMVLLKSQSLMHRVLSELSLHASYYVEGKLKEKEVYGDELAFNVLIESLTPAAFNKSLLVHSKDSSGFMLEEENKPPTFYKYGQVIEKPYGVFRIVKTPAFKAAGNEKTVAIKFNDIEGLANFYSTKLQVDMYSKKGSVLKLSLTDPVPEKGVDIINKLIEVYNKEEVEDKNQIAARTIDFIDERLQYLTLELSDVEKDVEQYKRRNELVDVSSQTQQYLAASSQYNKQVTDLSIQQEVVESIQRYLSKDGQYQIVPSSLTIQDPVLLGLINKFNELQLDRERMLRTTPAGNPIVKNVNEQLASLRQNILENLHNIKNSIAITQKNLEAKSGQFGARIQKVPVIERELVEITRQQETKQSLYLYLLQKREEAALSLAASVSNTRVIDPAIARGPVSPNRTNTYLYLMILGMFFPVAGVYLKDTLNSRITSKKDIQMVTSTPILGEIGHNKSGAKFVVAENSRAPIAEMFRLVRTNLKFFTVGRENKVLAVTSSVSGEGKTFFIINLGASLVSAGKKVVLVDFDLRKAGLHQELGLPEQQGITNYLISEHVTVDDIIMPSELVPGLSIISAGPIPPNPDELMMSPHVELLINELKARFDYIIIDTSPVGLVADAYALSSYLHSTIYVVRQDYTTKDQLSHINEITANKKFNNLMILLNDVKLKNGYKYGYGYGYNVEQPLKKKSTYSNKLNKV